jgi:EmrB/QacA subfamily drug resistance transporter
MAEKPSSAAGAGSGAYILIVISAAFASFMSKIDVYSVNISLPTIAEYFKADTTQVSRVVIVYMLVATSTLMLFGKLGDRIGVKRVFIAGYIVFTLGSLLCGLSWSINVLTAFRFFQGLGGAMLLASAFAIIAGLIPRELTGWAFGILSSGSALGVTFGAPLGGFINEYLSWQWIFLINVPVGVAAIILAIKVLPAVRPEKGGEEGFDIWGAVISLAGLALLFRVINTGGRAGWTSAGTVGMLLAAIAILALFVFWETRSRHPLLNFRLLRNPDFMRANLAAACGMMLMSGNSFLMPFYLELNKKLSTLQAGFTITLFSALFIFLSPIAGKLSGRIKPPLMTTFGMVSAACCCTFFIVRLPAPGLAGTLISMIWMAFSYAIFISPNNSMAMRFAPPGTQGAASGMFNTVNMLGTATGVAIMESLFSAHALGGGGDLDGASLRKVEPELLLGGFRIAYIFAACMCVCAAILSSMNIRKAGPGISGPERHAIHLH